MGEAERRTEMFAQIEPVLFRDGGEDLDDFRIKLRARATTNFFAGVSHGECTAVWAVANHCIERISDCENTGPERNLVTFKAARVAGAVVELLVSEDDFSSFLEEGDTGKHVVADLAMSSHALFFVVWESA